MNVSTSSQTKAFFQNYLAPYLSTSISSSGLKLSDLGYETPIKRSDGQVYTSLDKEAYRVVLNNGVVLPAFTSRYFNSTNGNKLYTTVVVLVDVNGPKKPNVFGKDIFQFAISLLGDGSIAMNGETKNYFKNNAYAYPVVSTKRELIDECKNTGYHCGALIKQNGWKVPDDYPLHI